MSVLRVQLLGDFQLRHDGVPLITSINARQQALLAYLLLHSDAPQSRHHLAFLFWPETGEAQALTNLRNLLYKLRQVLPDADQFVQTDAQTLQWRAKATYTLDVSDFLSLAASNRPNDLEQAVKLYRGDLLPSCYDDWILPERERLQQILLGLLEKLAVQAETLHDYPGAVRYATQLLQREPLREETYRRLMQLHAQNGDRAAAIHIYHTCVTTLHRELGIEPGPSTRQLYERLLNFQTQPVLLNLRPSVLPLVGRESEWTFLQGLWQGAKAWPPQLVLIKGEAGIGKTRLAEELMDWLNRQGVPMLNAHCYASQGHLAYAPLVEWLRSHPLHGIDETSAAELARLLPEVMLEYPELPTPTPLTQDWQRTRFFEVLAGALLKNHPLLVLHIEDMQWCDRDTLDWLHYLMHVHVETGDRSRLLLIGSLRTEEPPVDKSLESFLEDLRRTNLLAEIELGPLDESATFLLASHAVGRDLDPSLKQPLFQDTEGNPLFVIEMARAGSEAMESYTSEQASSSIQRGQVLPSKVRHIIEARLGQLSPSVQGLAGLAATAGRTFAFSVLRNTNSTDEQSLVRGLDELWQRRILREQGSDAYSFSHDKIREVAYTRMSQAQRKLSHRLIAEAMGITFERVLDSVSGQIARHYELAGLLEKAIPYYERAADAAQRIYANADAIRDYRRAIKLLEGPAQCSESSAGKLYERLGDLLHWTGQYGEARAMLVKAIGVVSPAEYVVQARLHRKIGNGWRDEHHYEQALQAYRETKSMLEQVRDQASVGWWEEWIQVCLEMNLVYYWLGQLHESDELRLELEPAVQQYAMPAQRAAYFQDRCWIEFRRNRSVSTPEMVSLSKAALGIYQETGNQAAIPAAQFSFGLMLLWHGEARAAIDLFQTALRTAEQTGDISLQARCLNYLTVAFRQCGQLEETRRYAERNLEISTRAEMPEYIATSKANQAWLAWRAGDLTLSEGLARAALDLWQQLPVGHASARFQWLALFPLMEVQLQEDKLSPAIESARALLESNQQRLPDVLNALLERAINAGDRTELESARSLLHQATAVGQQMNYL